MAEIDKEYDASMIRAAALVVKTKDPATAGIVIGKVLDGIYEDIPDTVECKKGCCFCCYSRVEITYTEAKTIETYIRMKFTGNQVKAMVKRARSNIRKLKKFKTESKFLLRMPCPLLNTKKGECMVYIARPLLCRSTFSNSAKACENAPNNP